MPISALFVVVAWAVVATLFGVAFCLPMEPARPPTLPGDRVGGIAIGATMLAIYVTLFAYVMEAR